MSIQYINTLIPYFDSDSLTKDYTFRDGLEITQENPKDFILPDTMHCTVFKYRDVTVYLRIRWDGLTVSRYQFDEDATSNSGLRSKMTGWLFYDSTKHDHGDIDLYKIHNDVRYRCHYVDYVLSHVNAMLK